MSLCVSVACRRDEPKEEGAPLAAPSVPSPNARILPAPLASTRGNASESSLGAGELPEVGSGAPLAAAAPPRPFPTSGELVPNGFPAPAGSLVELRGEFVWPELEARTLPISALPEAVLLDGTVRAAILSTRPELRLLMSPLGHLTVELASPTFSLPPGTQLRAQVDRLGHVVVWPDLRSYRVAPPGSLRALINERRVDVAPLFTGHSRDEGSGQKLGLATARRVVTGPMGRLTLESIELPAAGSGGTLVCRFLLELARLHASDELCPPGELPVDAHFAWTRGGELSFRVTALQRHSTWPVDVPAGTFEIPPPMPISKPGELPPERSPFLWDADTSAAFWGPAPPGAELVLSNLREVPMYVIVERLPLARVPALGVARWAAPRAAHSVSFRDFLGEDVYGARRVEGSGGLALGPTPPPPEVAEIEAVGLTP